jgi:hypothetical protein
MDQPDYSTDPSAPRQDSELRNDRFCLRVNVDPSTAAGPSRAQRSAWRMLILMDEQTLIAFAGIAGTLIAGLGGIYIGARLERKAEDRREAVAIQRAARVIDADLMIAETGARLCVEKKKWWVADRKLTLDGWQQYRHVIAAHLRWSDWVAVLVAVEAVGDLQGARDVARSIQLAEVATNPETRDAYAAAHAHNIDVTDPSPTIPESTVNNLIPMFKDVQAGRRALVSLTEG